MRRDGSLLGRAGSLLPRAVRLVAVGVLGLAAAHENRTLPAAVSLDVTVEMDPLPNTVLPLEVDARVEKWMRRFLTDQRETYETFLARESAFAAIIRGKLRKREMPEDLLYLAMIESGFSTRATSRVGAGGVWQFMSPTAKEYGLRVDRWVDERRDPVRATDAALDYLQWLYDRYGSWYLAAAAYNAGFGRVDRALKKHNAACALMSREMDGRAPTAETCFLRDDESTYWKIVEDLPRETREYVPKIIAATALARAAQHYGFRVVGGAAPYEFERVWVPSGTSLARVAREVGIEPALLKELNPQLVRGVTPPEGAYGLRVPVGSSQWVVAAWARRPVASYAADRARVLKGAGVAPKPGWLARRR